MPYIKPEYRDRIQAQLSYPHTVGELNFKLSITCKQFMDKHGLSYQTIQEIIGALECTKLEYYRRIASPYENEAMSRNGDIY